MNAFVYEVAEQVDETKKKRDADQEISYEHPEIPDWNETLITMLLMPLVIYGGFGRNVMISEKRSTLLLMSHAQEVFLHTLPLCFIIILNIRELGKMNLIDYITLGCFVANIIEVLAEMTVLRLYENIRINLELRQALKSQTRTIDLFKVSIVSAVFLLITIGVGFFAVP